MTVIYQAHDVRAFGFTIARCLILAGLVCGSWVGFSRQALAQAALTEPLSPKLPDGRQRAFPTAEGFGAGSLGGRGGKVVYVVNTNESGQGSLRACIEASGPRICIFRTGGTIVLRERSLVVRHPFLTIAGETAPGGGIAIRNGETQIRPSIEIVTNDVIIRHIRLRPGPHAVKACCSGGLGMYSSSAKDIMLDHISASWGSDETIDSEDASNFTWQWGIASEPLLRGGPGKDKRARNMLFTKGGNVSVHHSLFAFGQFRNPLIKMKIPGAVADVVNNVFFSPKWQYVLSFGDEWARIQANVVGNYKIAGEKLRDDHMVHLFEESGRGHAIYLKDNYDEPYRTGASEDDTLVLAEKQRRFVSASAFDAPAVRASAPEIAYEDVLAGAGATKPRRDAVDRRITEAVRNRSGRLLVNDPQDVGGWPELDAGVPYPDSDMDGISDDWEVESGTDPADASDGRQDLDGDGWTNLEAFLHFMAGDTAD
ncbi:thrombospondin type 3 repeat-containing protein [Sinorhizobium meliloti]|uniref:thrombospondin type 3 repeat-containing protein n=1 Tax=Rhizobium meliloti TaxID=382 RepID=UPI0013E3DDE0|nr:thrombospondin type 3 repeat-containing protein [Sinorhizobium meliloti]